MNQNEKKPSKAAKFFKGKGFYMVLAVCMVAVSGVAAATFLDKLSGIPAKSDTPETTATAARTYPTATATTPATTPTTADKAVAATTATAAPVTKAPVSSDLFLLPASNEVLQSFSEEPTYSETMNDYRAHTGVDFAAETGQEIKAAANGTVTKIDTDWLWGDMVTVRHEDDKTSVYCGVTATVKEGDQIAAGDVLGTLSGIPCESLMAPHLHLEVYEADTAIDAVSVIDGGVRYAEGVQPAGATEN